MNDSNMILVTGASGFIGGWVVEALALSGLANVRAGIHSWAHAARIARFPLDITPCDVMDEKQLDQAMEGVDLVVHTAVGGRETIVQGTQNVLRAARRAGVQRVVHLSTAEVYGDVRRRIDETMECRYSGSEYADAKIDAEKACWEFNEKGVPVTVLRPSIVYGPFSETWTMDLAARLQSGNWTTFQNYGDGICNLIYIDDLISAVVLALTNRNAVGEAFNVGGPDLVTWNEYFKRFNAALGQPELKAASASHSKWKSATTDIIRTSSKYIRDHLNEPISEIRQRFDWAEEMVVQMKKMVKSTPTARELENLYSREAIYVTEKARDLLGFQPQVDLDTGLQMSVCWLELYGLLKKNEAKVQA